MAQDSTMFPSGGPVCPEPWRSSFTGDPLWVPIHAGERLCKFASFPIDRERVLQSPWWMRQHELDELRVRAGRLGVPVAGLARSRMAIAREWNPGMETLFVITLARKVDGWDGTARAQPLTTASRDVLFTGGGRQLCVPGLTWEDIAQQITGTIR